MEEWRTLGGQLRKLIQPATFPVAVKLLNHASQIPNGAKRPLRDLNVKLAPCQGSGMARRYGWTVGLGPEDVACGIAAHTYGWERLTDIRGALDFLTRMHYARDKEAAERVMDGFRKLEMGDKLAVVYSPLEKTKVEPDVVLIYVNPAQLMRLVHGATHRSGMPVEGSFSGRAGSCTEGVIAAYQDETPKIVVPGNGDRVWAACQDHEMMMAVPAGVLDEIVEGLEKTHEKGIRYPIPTYMRYEPEVAFTLPLSDIFRPGEANEP
jgi:uncharacterized protein (DUF169 family)